ncbi:hypothetical protein CDD83_4085 [Cordyceps sp. RAO-2017]|nr:hypothetical protein CDD83_4085 [Cordyceps sp. RAO-2017]
MLKTKELAATVIRGIGIADLTLVREAICSRSAREPVHYERLEFLGDSILKYCTSAQAAADYPEWPEGYLSSFRDHLVSNSRLCRAAVDSGLVKFIVTRQFTDKKWRPPYVDGFLQGTRKPDSGSTMSTKTLADVVEALIGASYVDGGIPKATRCIATFLGDCGCDWRDASQSREKLFSLAKSKVALPPMLEPLEELLGYSFRKKALLIEAVTHGSYVYEGCSRSYERLEFLGDAVLDNIIVTRLFAIEPRLSHHQMHLLKSAMVNGDFLAFTVMKYGLRRSEGPAAEILKGGGQEGILSMWKFMRHGSSAIGLEQEATRVRFEALRDEIQEAMDHGSRYPWVPLARMQAKKFFSDLFEAVLGAVWVDSGSQDACEAVVGRFGILSYLERLLRDGVDARHPKQELGIRAVSRTVDYVIDVRENGEGKLLYVCKVLVGDRLVAEVDDGVSKEESQTRAAREAIDFLNAEEAQAALVCDEATM